MTTADYSDSITAPELIDVFELLGIIRSHLTAFVIVFLATIGVSAALAFMVTPIYRADVLLAPVSDPSAPQGLSADSLPSLVGLAGISIGDSGGRDEHIALLSSRALAELFIERHHLLPELYAESWDSSRNTWRDDVGDPPTLSTAAKRFVTSVTRVTEHRGSRLVTFTVEWRDPKLAAQWANDYVAEANKAARQRAIDEATRSIEYLETEASKTNVVELRQAIYRLIETHINRRMLASVRSDFAFRVLDPAKAPHPSDFIWPNRPMFVLVGALAGLLLGFAVAGALHLRPKNQRARSPSTA